jgi:hypothetical protein
MKTDGKTTECEGTNEVHTKSGSETNTSVRNRGTCSLTMPSLPPYLTRQSNTLLNRPPATFSSGMNGRSPRSKVLGETPQTSSRISEDSSHQRYLLGPGIVENLLRCTKIAAMNPDTTVVTAATANDDQDTIQKTSTGAWNNSADHAPGSQTPAVACVFRRRFVLYVLFWFNIGSRNLNCWGCYVC